MKGIEISPANCRIMSLQVMVADRDKKLEALRAENEKLRGDVRTAVFADSAELKDVKRDNEALRGLLREAWVKMEANNLWSNLRARAAAALKETRDE